jgi:hypothetical protein
VRRALHGDYAGRGADDGWVGESKTDDVDREKKKNLGDETRAYSFIYPPIGRLHRSFGQP